jgi:hypothetical protein
VLHLSEDGRSVLSAGEQEPLDPTRPFVEGRHWDENGVRLVAEFRLPSESGGLGGGRGGGFGEGRGWGRRRQMEEQDAQRSFAPGRVAAAILLVDRDRADRARRRAAWTCGSIVVAGWLVVVCVAIAWRATVRLAEAGGRARTLEVEARHFRDLSQAAPRLAHETRNPLGLIRGWPQRLAETGTDSCDGLSERQDDLLPLARRFAVEFACAPVRLSPQAVQCLLAYGWPGNVRELRNAIQRSCLLCRGDVILPEYLPPIVAALISETGASAAGRLSKVERAAILATLEERQGNRTHAANKLGISRPSSIYKLHAIEEDRQMNEPERAS